MEFKLVLTLPEISEVLRYGTQLVPMEMVLEHIRTTGHPIRSLEFIFIANKKKEEK